MLKILDESICKKNSKYYVASTKAAILLHSNIYRTWKRGSNPDLDGQIEFGVL